MSKKGHRSFKDVKAETKPVFKADKEKRLSFSHRYICQGDHAAEHCDFKQLKSLVEKLRILSELEWLQIKSSPRTTHGTEAIPRKTLKRTVPRNVPNDAEILVFRFGGSKGGRLAGYLDGMIYYILFVDSKFDLYDH